MHAIAFFAEDGWTGFLVLGTVFLVLTGGEALYADLGHFGRSPIQLGWFTVALPALLLNYAGQGALMLRHPEAAENPFFLMAPSWARYPLIGLATLATIIASQALISGAFSITLQAQQLGFLPRMRTIHTSPTAIGQIYIPFVNWTLMIACLLTIIGFRSSTNLAAAYGVAVTATMAITTILFGVVARRRWRWSPVLVSVLAGFFLVIDAAFLTANVIKIPQGGWFPLVVAAVIVVIMTTWKRGTQLVFTRERNLEMSLRRLQERFTANPPTRVPGTAIFFSSNPGGAPAALLTNLKYNGVAHERVLMLTVETSDVPHLADEERFTVEELGAGLYRGRMRYGFMEEPNVPEDLPAFVRGRHDVRLAASPLLRQPHPGHSNQASWDGHLAGAVVPRAPAKRSQPGRFLLFTAWPGLRDRDQRRIVAMVLAMPRAHASCFCTSPSTPSSGSTMHRGTRYYLWVILTRKLWV